MLHIRMYPWLPEHCVYMHATVNIVPSEERVPVTATSNGDLRHVSMSSQPVLNDTFTFMLFDSVSTVRETTKPKQSECQPIASQSVLGIVISSMITHRSCSNIMQYLEPVVL